MNHRATHNDTVTIHYTTRTCEGGVIEDTMNRKPLVLNLSDQMYADALRNSILGMQPGEEKRVVVPAEHLFGHRDHHRQLSVPLRGLPAGIREGAQLSVTLQGKEVDVWVVQLLQDEAVLDTNHPLAGETIEYTIRLLSILTP